MIEADLASGSGEGNQAEAGLVDVGLGIGPACLAC